jgi:hypothetical protein
MAWFTSDEGNLPRRWSSRILQVFLNSLIRIIKYFFVKEDYFLQFYSLYLIHFAFGPPITHGWTLSNAFGPIGRHKAQAK